MTNSYPKHCLSREQRLAEITNFFISHDRRLTTLVGDFIDCDVWCLFLSPGGMRGGRKVIVEPHKHKGESTHTLSCVTTAKWSIIILSCEAKI